MKIEVKRSELGWIVVDGETLGPFVVKARAVDLAEGMAQTLRDHGEEVELIIDPEHVR